MNVAFLNVLGTDDPTVAFSEGMNFYNTLRYDGKEAYLFAYPVKKATRR